MKSHSLSDRHAEPAGFKRSDVDAGVVVLAGHGGVDRKGLDWRTSSFADCPQPTRILGRGQRLRIQK